MSATRTESTRKIGRGETCILLKNTGSEMVRVLECLVSDTYFVESLPDRVEMVECSEALRPLTI